ncbi:MAG TPA: arginine--tRNA ligase [Solirubrobacteraceae bacterium]|jgi:arginyl-tRNA synthetase|nr:arginine--tRNA ligase [Solirubrobacteraceae bacterium]
MSANLFDYFEDLPARDGENPPWAARAPRRPHKQFDLKLVPRLPNWQEDQDSLQALAQIEREPWAAQVTRGRDGVTVRLADAWIEATGAALEAGGSAEATLADLAQGERFSVQFWDANATKALHVGHLRNLAIGNALAAALAQAGAQVERRSLISDAGRSMGEAMAGVMNSGRHAHAWLEGDEKSDHFVGVCYADYVAAGGAFGGEEVDYPEDSLTRELTLRGDAADELLKRVLSGERAALELWYKTRAWVISGQRKTLARLGIAFDRVFFESDFLEEAAELTRAGLRDGRLRRREDGVVIYATGLADFEEFPLVRADGLPTQHMRALAYWMAAPDLGQMTSMQVCGTEWVSHVTSRRKLMDELLPRANGSPPVQHPTHDIFNGMVARQKRALTSSEGGLLIDELTEWIDDRIDCDPDRREVRRGHPFPERIAAQVALGYFLPYPVAPRIDFDTERLLDDGESLGWDLARARAHHAHAATPTSVTGSAAAARSNGGRPAEDPQYRFAVVQSELYRRYLRLAVQRLDVRPLAHYLKHLARWHLEGDRSEHVERIVQTLLERSARGLGLEATR